MPYGWGWKPYVSVAQRRANAAREIRRMAKEGKTVEPVRITHRGIATTFWGRSWCGHLEKYCDYANRMPRGRTYARNGSILDLKVESGRIDALVQGSDLYHIHVKMAPLAREKWQGLCQAYSQEITSVLDLMRGKLTDRVLAKLTDPKTGLFPAKSEIKFDCDCPDGALMCKHIAAVLYGVGHRLDTKPELFFLLRGVDHAELVAQAVDAQDVDDVIGLQRASELAAEELGDIFGIDLASGEESGRKVVEKRSIKRVVRKRANASASPSATVGMAETGAKTPAKAANKSAKKTAKKTVKKTVKRVTKKTAKKAAKK
ncbi:MAG: SWIM zinc finger family protein, partial [Planctomycetales bacterium]|nr:SWIM zinc finger family protein [Planctomycetales bacterium]